MFSEMSMLVEQQDETIVNVETQAMGVDHDISEGRADSQIVQSDTRGPPSRDPCQDGLVDGASQAAV